MSETPRTQSEAETYQRLRAHLAFLKLTDAAEALPRVLDEARAHKLSLVDGFEKLLGVEVTATEDRRLTSRLRFACLPAPWRLADFDFSAQPGIDEPLIRELATLRFIDQGANILFIGPPGVGKTMLAVGLARAGAGRAPGLLHHRSRPGRTLPQGCHRGPLGFHDALLRRPPTPGV